MSTISIDYETRSRCDLKTCGGHRYAEDPSTEALMCAVSSHDSEDVYLWVRPGLPVPAKYVGQNAKAESLIAQAELLYAHNAPFEQAVTWGTLKRKAVSPFATEPPLDRWRCTAAMARKAGLPSSLEQLALALSLDTQKDNKGKALIRYFSLPNKDGEFNDPAKAPEKWEQFCDYCVTDVVVEKKAHKKLKAFELTGALLDTFIFDMRLNQRGIPVNVPGLRHAQKIIETVQVSVTEEFQKKTGFNPTQRAKVLELVQSMGVPIENMQADTLDDLPTENVSPEAAHIIEMYRKLSFAATKKVAAMLEMACEDDRVRGCHVFYGTGPGRWAARGIQPQNFKKTPKWMRSITDEVYQVICKGYDAEALDAIYGNPIELISGCIRHFIHKPGTEMLDADYSAIQARGICWLANEKAILQMWRDGRDLYKFMAAEVNGISEKHITDDQRSFGKVLELACLGGDTQVVTRQGLKIIREVNSSDELWDGIWKSNDLEYFNTFKPRESADNIVNSID